MTSNTISMSAVDESTPSKEPSPAHGHTSKLELSDGSSIYAKLVVSENLFICWPLHSFLVVLNLLIHIPR